MFFLLAPSQSPGLVAAYNFSSSILIVKWSHLPEEHFHGPPIGYIVTYYAVDLEGEIKFVKVNFTTSTTTLTNLTVYTMYVINVSAVSSGGIGPANTIQVRTGAEGTVGLSFLRYSFGGKANHNVDLMISIKKRERLKSEHGQIVPSCHINLFPITDGTRVFAKGATLSFRKSRKHIRI